MVKIGTFCLFANYNVCSSEKILLPCNHAVNSQKRKTMVVFTIKEMHTRVGPNKCMHDKANSKYAHYVHMAYHQLKNRVSLTTSHISFYAFYLKKLFIKRVLYFAQILFN